MSRRRMCWLVLLPLLLGAGGSEEVVRNRVTLGADVGLSPVSEEALGLGGLIDERLRATVIDREGLQGELRIKARLRYQLSEEASRWENSRVRDLRLHLVGTSWELDLGRIPVDHGLRLIDGAMGMFELLPGWSIGAYGGAGADPYTTRPGLRFGGGPVLRFEGESVHWLALGELMWAPGGLDRAAFVTDGRAELTEVIELSARVDVQHRGPDQPLSLADGMLSLSARPLDELRLSAFYDAYSSLAYLITEKQDPSITRFDARATSVDPELGLTADTLDPTLYQLVGLGGRYAPALGEAGLRLHLAAQGRYRYHADPDRRFQRITLEQGLHGLLGQRLDLRLAESLIQWSGSTGAYGTLFIYAEPLQELPLAFDVSVEAGLRPLIEDPSVLGLQLYADGYVDWISPHGRFLVSAGYAFARVLDFDVWDDYHAGIARLTWYEKVKRRSE